MDNKNLDVIINHLVTSGFFYPSSLIYGGLANTWDYGPLGVELKNNLKRYWWKKFVSESPNNVGIDSAILMNKKVWEATGHVQTFNDPLVDCKECKSRYRADNLISDFDKTVDTNKMTFADMDKYIEEHDITCPFCHKKNFTKIKQFNMMFATNLGPTVDDSSKIFLRPETAQGMFVNFKNVQRSQRKKLPFGICNIGKVFRNEITPGNFIFRVREFEQMEMEFFCAPNEDLKWFEYWKEYSIKFVESLGVSKEKLRYRDHEKEELAFYSKATTDIEYNFPSLGFSEIVGIADRTDYDLKRHIDYSKEKLDYFDEESKTTFIPYCIEPSFGVERTLLMCLVDSYDEEILKLVDGKEDKRIVMHLNHNLAPYEVAVLPLSKQLNSNAQDVAKEVRKMFRTVFDETGSIGKRYRRQDAIGTPFCVTIDFQTLEDKMVTVRDRDSMKQDRVLISELHKYLMEKLEK